MIKPFAILSFALTAWLMASSLKAADMTPPSPDVVGIKLGMSVSEAIEQLKKYRGDVKIATGFATDNMPQIWPNEAGSGLGMFENSDSETAHRIHDAKIRIPVSVIDPPPINESGSGVILDRIRTLFMEQRNGEEEVHGGADHRAFAAS
jgi:hypothetical protein